MSTTGTAAISLGGAGDMTARLTRWAAEARVDEAARERSRERWLSQQAGEGSSLAGILVDLAERGEPVVLRTAGGRHRHGRIRAVGVDFLVMSPSPGRDVLAPLAAVSALQPRPGSAPPTGDRPVRSDLRVLEVLAALAAERAHVVVVTAPDGEATRGFLRAVGRDVLTLRGDGPEPTHSYVPLAAVGEVLLA